MPQTPDRFHGEADEEGIILEDRLAGDDPPLAGGMRYVVGNFSFRDIIGLFNPRSGFPTPNQEGEFIVSADGLTFGKYKPIASDAGMLVDDDGTVVLVG